MTSTFADRIISFNLSLIYDGLLPEGFKVINPFENHSEAIEVMKRFYKKYYDDDQPRKFIIGINPGRHGAAVTGVPFTDTKRLEAYCSITMKTEYTHEVSSIFVYDMITAYGGPQAFYRDFYINSPFPLAIVKQKPNGNWVNANYYDEPVLMEMMTDFMINNLQQQIACGLKTEEVVILGVKNAKFVEQLNQKVGLYNAFKILEHPRYIQQYKSKEKLFYIEKYINTLKSLK